MSAMHPKVKMPLWAALALVAAAYVFRSIVVRGGDFRPDMPLDAIALGAFAVGFAGVAYLRWRTAKEREDELAEEEQEEHDGA